MNVRFGWLCLVPGGAVLLAALAGCDGDDPSGPGDDGDGTTAAGPSSEGGVCDGYAVECYKLDSISSCFEQRGCFQTGEDCTGKQVFCDITSAKADCIGQLGCYWINDDGTREEMPKGTCSGTALPCKQITDEATCKGQARGACEWDAAAGTCDRDFAVTAECFDFTNDTLFPAEQKLGCEKRTGCTWTPS